MVRQIRCECGYIARGASDDEVIGLIQIHVAADHPELVEVDTPDYLRNWIELVPD
jgi:predicted small metal-binding protein